MEQFKLNGTKWSPKIKCILSANINSFENGTNLT